MAIDKKNQNNIDNSDLIGFPNGRIRDNEGSNNGTPVNRTIYSDIHEFFAKIMRKAKISYSNQPDSEINGYQLVDAVFSLGNKNSLIYTISLNSGLLSIPTALSILQENEFLLCKSAFNLNLETNIKGTDSPVVSYSISVDENIKFKINDYIRLTRTNIGFLITRLCDSTNFDDLATELNYLKAASLIEEYAGSVQNKATTPYTNQLAFARRIIGLDSSIFLATNLRNGLMSQADKIKLDEENKVKNIGFASGIDIGAGNTGATYAVSGNIVSATLLASPANTSIIRIVVQNTMTNTDYYVRILPQSLNSNIAIDGNIIVPVFKPINATSFDISIRETVGGMQNLKLHFEVVKI